MAFGARTKRALRTAGRYECCELCGGKAPRLANNGLQAAHIVSDSSGGADHPDNAIVLCHSCAEVFDRYLKAKVVRAFALSNERSQTTFFAPPDWITGEGRRARGDDV